MGFQHWVGQSDYARSKVQHCMPSDRPKTPNTQNHARYPTPCNTRDNRTTPTNTAPCNGWSPRIPQEGKQTNCTTRSLARGTTLVIVLPITLAMASHLPPPPGHLSREPVPKVLDRRPDLVNRRGVISVLVVAVPITARVRGLLSGLRRRRWLVNANRVRRRDRFGAACRDRVHQDGVCRWFLFD